jgi:hypothetical protein
VGQETRWVMRFAGAEALGKAPFASENVRFRNGFKRTIAFLDMRTTPALAAELRAGIPDGTATFALGPLAGSWARRIRTPRTLIDKLDVRSDSRVAVLGINDPEFLMSLRQRTPLVHESDLATGLDLLILRVESRHALKDMAALQHFLKPTGGIWIVAPKGQAHLTELDVLAAGRAANYTASKVVRFSETLTAYKFVISRTRG